MKNKTTLGFETLILNIYKSDFVDIRNYLQKLTDTVHNENIQVISAAEKLRSKGVPEEEIADILDSDSYNAGIFETNTFNFALVFLYSQCEKTLKTDFCILSNKCKKIKGMFKWNSCLKVYDDLGIKLSKNSHFNSLNELRLFNNCIKHDGRISKELSDLNKTKWIIRDKIKITEAELNGYCSEAEAFFDELTPIIDKKNRENNMEEFSL